MAAALLTELHGGLYRVLCKELKEDFEGLGAAARYGHKQGKLPRALCNKMVRLDMVVAWVRHANVQKADKLLDELQACFSNSSPAPSPSPTTSRPSSETGGEATHAAADQTEQEHEQATPKGDTEQEEGTSGAALSTDQGPERAAVQRLLLATDAFLGMHAWDAHADQAKEVQITIVRAAAELDNNTITLPAFVQVAKAVLTHDIWMCIIDDAADWSTYFRFHEEVEVDICNAGAG